MQEIKTTTTHDECAENVMRRVRRVYVWKTFGKPFVIECVLLGGVLTTSVFFISVRNVYSNMSDRQSLTDISRFAMSAFQHTELSTKTLSVAALILAGLITRDTMQACSRVVHRIRVRLTA
jgi:hypothetical protein